MLKSMVILVVVVLLCGCSTGMDRTLLQRLEGLRCGSGRSTTYHPDGRIEHREAP